MPGPANDAAAVCSASSVQSVSPPPAQFGQAPEHTHAYVRSGWPTGSGMAGFGSQLKKNLGAWARDRSAPTVRARSAPR